MPGQSPALGKCSKDTGRACDFFFFLGAYSEGGTGSAPLLQSYEDFPADPALIPTMQSSSADGLSLPLRLQLPYFS